MLFKKIITTRISLPPHCFNDNILNELRRTLYNTIEGTSSKSLGTIICILDIHDITQCIMRDGEGEAIFNVRYEALILKHSPMEVNDAVVKQVIKTGIFASIGPQTIFVSNHLIPNSFTYDDSAGGQSYVNHHNGQRIAADDTIRVRIIGIGSENSLVNAVGTIMEECLGCI